MSNSASLIARETVDLMITYQGGRSSTHSVAEGKVLMVGSASHHGLSLQSDGIAHTHCMITLREGQIHVRDWNSPTGTFLNGRRLEEEGVLRPGDAIRIGNCSLEIAGSKHRLSQAESTIPSEWAIAEEGSPADEDLGSKLLKMIEEATQPQLYKAVDLQITETLTEVSDVLGLLNQAESSELSSLDDWFAAIPTNQAAASVAEDSHDSGFLKRELEDRDARIRELEALVDDSGRGLHQEHKSDQDKAVKTLSNRLQQVLDELEKSDERVTLLTDLLARADVASRAAEEERTQIENWIGEIEQLFSARESEWHAQRDTLQKRIDGITAQRDDLERKLVSGGTSRNPGMSAQNSEQLQQMQSEIQRLRKSLETVTEERNQLANKIQQEHGEHLKQKVQSEVEAQLRLERLQLAEERTELARMRQEQSPVQQVSASEPDRQTEDPRAVDYRIRAFREHLREIHETDPKPVNSKDTMSHRLGKLWRKLNGTPLDTD